MKASQKQNTSMHTFWSFTTTHSICQICPVRSQGLTPVLCTLIQANTMCIKTILFHDNILTPSILYAILSFPCELAGVPNNVIPQHLKDMIGPPAGEGSSALISALTSFVNMVLSGEVLAENSPCVIRCKFICIMKEWRGVGPIAVGNTLRRLVAKCVGLVVMEEMGELLAPTQLDYGVKCGAKT